MSALWRLALVVGQVGSSSLLAERTHAGPLSALAKLAKLAKGGKAVGAGAKAAKASTAAKALALGGSALAAERAAGLFAVIPDDAARLATYVTRTDGELMAVGRSLDTATGAAALERARAAADVYMDMPAALTAEALSTAPDARMFVLNANGQAVKVERIQTGDVVEFVIDGTDAAFTVSEFVVDQLENQDSPGQTETSITPLPMLPARCSGGVREALGGVPVELKDFSVAAVQSFLSTARDGSFVVLTVDELVPAEFIHQLKQAPNRVLIAVLAEPCTSSSVLSVYTRLADANRTGTRVPFLKEPAFELKTWTERETLAGFGKFKTPTLELNAFGFVIPFHPAATQDSAEADDDPPWYFMLGAGVFIVGLVGFNIRRARKKKSEAEAQSQADDS